MLARSSRRLQQSSSHKCRKFDMVAWVRSAGKHSRSAILSSLTALLVVVYTACLLLWGPDIPVFVPSRTIENPRARSAEAFSSSDDQQQPVPAGAIAIPVQKLLSDLKEAARVAADSVGLPFSYTEKEREKWRKENPCRARLELPPLFAQKGSRNVARNRQWEAVLDEYSVLHRTCIRNIKNLESYFQNESAVPGCKFVTGESLFGLGNKITYAASVVLYGILTQRVVLFYEWKSWMPVLMCEPFDGSSWRLPQSLEYLNKRNQTPHNVNEEMMTNSTAKFLAWVDREKAANGGGGRGSHGQPHIYHTEVDDGWQPVGRFFCDSEQEFLSRVRWMSMAGCLYFMPKLFAVTSFRPVLEALFPDRMALTHVLRSVFLPYNVAWDRIQRNHDMFLKHADKRVSIQVRYRHGAYEYSKLRDPVNRHTIRCLLENGILPNISYSGVHDARSSKYDPGLGEESRPPSSITKVLITSLYTDLHELLQDMYLRHPTVTGESVGFVQLTHESDQHWGFEADTQALVEIILLSLSDEMLVTPLSTFGGVAQAYGGLKPWIVEHTEQQSSSNGSCVRASSVDLCYQRATDTFSCPHDVDVHNKKIYDHVPYIEKCLAIDSPSGLVLVTS